MLYMVLEPLVILQGFYIWNKKMTINMVTTESARYKKAKYEKAFLPLVGELLRWRKRTLLGVF